MPLFLHAGFEGVKMSHPYSDFWAGLELSGLLKKYERLMSTVIRFARGTDLVSGFFFCVGSKIEYRLTDLGFRVFACTERAYKCLSVINDQYPWGKPGCEGFEIPEEIYHRGFYSCFCSGQFVTVAVYVTAEDQLEVEGWVDPGEPPVLEEVTPDEVVAQFGSPEWPDDVVLFQGLERNRAFFPSHEVCGYLSSGGGSRVAPQTIEEYCRASLQLFLEAANSGQFAISHPEFERWFVLSPLQAFTRLRVFPQHLGASFGLNGYGQLTPADLAEMRKDVYAKWFQKHFPHLVPSLEVACSHKFFAVVNGERVCETCGQKLDLSEESETED